jgi:2-polyprenyl-6-methoxyphenol hydroxylase-like FAD-dependent oxidoreductase
MKTRTVLISGAGIAGPALAYCLSRAGIAATVVEAAPALRRGGQAVDFRGPVHRAVLEKMNVWDAIHERQTHLGEHQMLNAEGAVVAHMPALMFSGDVEILRGDLSQLLYERTVDHADYVFGDSIVGLEQTGDGVRVTFQHGSARTFDLVIGADGLHSRVRALTFGEEAAFLRHHGYAIAGFTMPNVLGLRRTAMTYSVPRLSVSVSSARSENEARTLFCFKASPETAHVGAETKRQAVEAAFAEVGWHVPKLLAELGRATDVYFDHISSVHLNEYTKGRVALVGDAAYGGTLGGNGTPLAIVGAYVLAGELVAADGDHQTAFARYDAVMRPYAQRGQAGTKHVGGFHAPPHWLSLQVRNLYLRVFATRWFKRVFERIVRNRSEGFELPEYEWPVAADLPSLVLLCHKAMPARG